jgi:hypothetical protein
MSQVGFPIVIAKFCTLGRAPLRCGSEVTPTERVLALLPVVCTPLSAQAALTALRRAMQQVLESAAPAPFPAWHPARGAQLRRRCQELRRRSQVLLDKVHVLCARSAPMQVRAAACMGAAGQAMAGEVAA